MTVGDECEVAVHEEMAVVDEREVAVREEMVVMHEEGMTRDGMTYEAVVPKSGVHPHVGVAHAHSMASATECHSWNHATDCDCTDNSQCRSNCR